MRAFTKLFSVAGILLVSLLVMSSAAIAKNMHLTHDNDYEYTIDGETFFPVVWDIRGAWMNYFYYALYYAGFEEEDAFDYADDKLAGVLTQAKNAGVNSVIIRGTLGNDVNSGRPLYFPGRANMIREMGLNIIPGGFRHIQGTSDFNANMRTYIESYLSQSFPLNYAPVVGIHGFNEPDGVYDAADQTNQGHILDSLSYYHTWSNNLGLPLSSFMAMPAAYVPSLVDPHDDTESTIYQLCSRLDFPMLDWYPCRTYNESADILAPEADIWGATDLFPTDISSNHYNAYNTRDELWSLTHDESSGNTTFRVYEITGEEQMGMPGFSQIYFSQPSLAWPFEVSSSDYRASDIGDRSLAEHNQNAAVVMYHTGEQIEQAEVVIHNGTALATVNPPNLNETASTVLFCVGEDNYSSADLSVNGNTGIIGRAEMRILWYGDGVSGSQLLRNIWILEKNSSGNDLTNTISTPLTLPGSFTPTGAVWGYFWDDTFPHRQSGFILYNDAGNYVVVYTQDGDNWGVSATVHSGLFGTGVNPGAVIAYRETTWPVTSYSPAKDILCSLVNLEFTNSMYMHWSSGDGTTMEMGLDSDKFYIKEAAASSYNHLSFRHVWNSNETRFFFGGDGVETYYTQISKHFPTDDDGTGGWSGETAVNLYSAPDWGVMNSPMRARHTRRAFVNAIMDKPSSGTVSIRGGEMRGNNNKLVSDAEYSSTSSYIDNLCRAGHPGITNENGAFDLEFEWGINQTSEDNCLFANIQAFGKYPMLAASFPPSHNTGPAESDTLLYLTVAPIVHGCRGISFYALDMALQSGPVSSGGTTPLFRAPSTLLNWGPSRDCEENADIVSWVHDVAKMLTGKYGGPDFLAALVDHSSFTVLENDVFNAITCFGDVPSPGSESINFIALEEDQTGDILLIVSKDNSSGVAPFVVFGGTDARDYDSVEYWGGWDPNTALTASESGRLVQMPINLLKEYSAVSAERGGLMVAPLAVDFSCMPSHTVSLLRIPWDGGTDSSSDNIALPEFQVRRSGGTVTLQVSGELGHCDLSLFDITGRKVEEINLPEAEDHEVILSTDSYSAGMYFVVLREEADIVQMEKISIF
ncbi:MAG: T9SS type A sorting domain-containing protein [Candidatus Sabulitectum sp.]|nr:T9SS type A sorting domain-containing protein [Candidatus Sabulitectum sp.]